MMTMLEYLGQDRKWISFRDGRVLNIADMTEDHRSRAARFLLDNATPLVILMESAVQASEDDAIVAGPFGKVITLLQMISDSPKNNIMKTPLYRALIKGIRDA